MPWSRWIGRGPFPQRQRAKSDGSLEKPSGLSTVFRSPLTAWMYEDNERANTVRKGFISRVPKGRLGEPSDLAGPLLFLASAASDFYTGHILYADGGYTAG